MHKILCRVVGQRSATTSFFRQRWSPREFDMRRAIIRGARTLPHQEVVPKACIEMVDLQYLINKNQTLDDRIKHRDSSCNSNARGQRTTTLLHWFDLGREEHATLESDSKEDTAYWLNRRLIRFSLDDPKLSRPNDDPETAPEKSQCGLSWSSPHHRLQQSWCEYPNSTPAPVLPRQS